MGAAKGQGLIRNLFDPRRTPSTSVLWSLSEPLVLLTNKWTPLWDARFLNWKTNFINNKTSRLSILTNSKCLRLLLDFHGCFLKYEEQKLPQLWGRCQLQPCWEECVMLSFSIHESKIWICIGHFPPSSCTVILFFFPNATYFTYADASSMLIWPLEQFFECHLSRKISVSPELLCWIRSSPLNPPSKIIKTLDYMRLIL